MIDEMCGFQSNGTWELVPFLDDESIVECWWLYTLKIGPDGNIDCHKAQLVAKGYTQIYG